METIDKLQDKINLLKFDKTNDNIKIHELKAILKRKNKIIEYAVQELDMIEKNDKIKEILKVLKSSIKK